MASNLQLYTVPLISVVMPVFNGRKFLRQAIESVINQTYKNFELLIIYDDSGDGSLEIIKEYLLQDSRIKLIYGNNEKLIGALNLGLSVAEGKFIARMDSDDVSLPTRFEKQIQLMELVGADICGSHWLVINEDGKLIEAKIAPLSDNSFTICLAFTVPFAHGSVVMRTSFLKSNSLRYGGVQYAEDYDLWIRFYEAKAIFVNIDEFLFLYRKQKLSLTNQVMSKNALDAKILRRHFIANNHKSCIRAIDKLINKKNTLSQWEEVLIILTSFLLFRRYKNLILLKVLRLSSKKSIGIAILYLIQGI